MLYNKACAITLLNKVKKECDLIIEDQYTKSDLIFYKFKYSNIAVTKRLNNLDFSILSKEDWDFLFDTVTKEYIEKHEEELETAFNEYYLLIDSWSKEKSLISKMYNFVNNTSLNNKALAEAKRTLEQNKSILDLLIHNRARIAKKSDHNIAGYDIALDVAIERNIAPDNFKYTNKQCIKVELIVEPTDNNLNVIREVITEDIRTGRDEDSVFVNKVNTLLGFLIMKYNRNREDQSYIEHKKALYKIKNPNTVSEEYNDASFIEYYKSLLLNLLISPRSILLYILFGSYNYGYYSLYEMRREIEQQRPELDIDYSAMSDDHLNLFKEKVEWLINRHANYIGVDEREKEGFLMFLGEYKLKGKKLTKEALTGLFNLPNMYAEIERRRGER